MTARALCGLLVLHGMYLAVGGSVLLSLRGWSRWRSAVRLAGLAYLLGVATLGIAWTLLLVVGVPFGPVTIVVSSLVVVGAGLFVRRRRGGVERPPEASSRGSRGLPGLVTVIGIVAAGGYLVALFRVARLNGLFSFDGWAFWVTRGKAVYFFDGFDEQVFSAVPHPSYPPVIPILDAAAFHAMGSADVVTLHVQYWFLAVGFVAAAAGLLSRRVPAWILWPGLLLALVLPRMRSSVLAAQADLPLDYLVVAAAILVALWLGDRHAWQLQAAGILLACGARNRAMVGRPDGRARRDRAGRGVGQALACRVRGHARARADACRRVDVGRVPGNRCH